MDEWWPTLLRHIPKENPSVDEMITVAEISKGGGNHDYDDKVIITALVPTEAMENLSANFCNFSNYYFFTRFFTRRR